MASRRPTLLEIADRMPVGTRRRMEMPVCGCGMPIRTTHHKLMLTGNRRDAVHIDLDRYARRRTHRQWIQPP